MYAPYVKIGAKLSSNQSLKDVFQQILYTFADLESSASLNDPHASINKVMFVTALDKGYLRKT
eukprot:Awhi_evm1s13831